MESEHTIMKFNLYLKEAKYLRAYIITTFLGGLLFYSVFLFLDGSAILRLTEEDHLYEWLTVVFFLGSSVLSLMLFLRKKNLFFILFFVAFFFAAGEEISWGQRIIGFETPEKIKERNIQDEFTLHNLEAFSRMNSERNLKSGFARLLEFNFLFKAGTLLYGIVLPFLVFHFRAIRNLTKWMKLPVPPITIGVFFLFNWMIYRYVNVTVPQYALRSGEIMECFAALIFLAIFFFYYRERKSIDYIGSDIKHSLDPSASVRFV